MTQTLETYITFYLSSLSAIGKSRHTIRNYRYDLHHFLEHVKENSPELVVNTSEFRSLVLSYITALFQTTEGESYEIRSLNRKRSSMRSFIRYLTTIQVIPIDFSSEITLIKPPPPDNTILSDREIIRILRIHDERIQYGSDAELQLMHHRNKVAFLTLLDTAIKVSELVLLQWSFIRFMDKNLVVPPVKGLESRVVPLTDRLIQELLAYQQRLKNSHQFDETSKNDYLFFPKGGLAHTPINPKTIERMMNSIVRQADIHKKMATAQSLRNTKVIKALEAQSIQALTPILGYARHSVTKTQYLNH